MVAITHLRVEEHHEEPTPIAGAAARAAAARSRGTAAKTRAARSRFAGDGRLTRPAPPVRLTSVRLVANDDLAPTCSSRSASPSGDRRSARDRTPSVGSRARRTATTAATYRRRRLVAAAVAVALILATAWVLGALGGGPLTASERGTGASAVELPMQPVSRATTVVQPGDTLWSIARELQPEGDVRPLVDALAAQRNGRALQVGETIVLP